MKIDEFRAFFEPQILIGQPNNLKEVINLRKQLVEPYENNDNLIDYWFKSRTNRSESITIDAQHELKGEFRSLLEGLLKFVPSSRLSAEQFIQHSFFKVQMFHKYIKNSKICISTILKDFFDTIFCKLHVI